MACAIGPAMRRMRSIDASIMEVHWDKRNWCFTFITDMSAILLKTIKPRKAIKTYNRFTPNRDSTSEINFIDGGLLSAYCLLSNTQKTQSLFKVKLLS